MNGIPIIDPRDDALTTFFSEAGLRPLAPGRQAFSAVLLQGVPKPLCDKLSG